MKRDAAIQNAKRMRELEARMRKAAQDPRSSFGERYEAVIKAEDYDEAARGYDKIAERPLQRSAK